MHTIQGTKNTIFFNLQPNTNTTTTKEYTTTKKHLKHLIGTIDIVVDHTQEGHINPRQEFDKIFNDTFIVTILGLVRP